MNSSGFVARTSSNVAMPASVQWLSPPKAILNDALPTGKVWKRPREIASVRATPLTSTP